MTALNEQALPIPNVAARWPSGGKYPDYVLVKMSDGQTVKYLREIVQPEPVFPRTERRNGYRRRINDD